MRCVYCGCTDDQACVLDEFNTPCAWAGNDPPRCDNPMCELAHAEREQIATPAPKKKPRGRWALRDGKLVEVSNA